jgi:hypothetical protein
MDIHAYLCHGYLHFSVIFILIWIILVCHTIYINKFYNVNVIVRSFLNVLLKMVSWTETC